MTRVGSSREGPHPSLRTGCGACRVPSGAVCELLVLVRRIVLADIEVPSAAAGKGLSAQKRQELARRHKTMLAGQSTQPAVAETPVEVEAVQQVLMLTYNCVTGGSGRMTPPAVLVTPVVMSAVCKPNVSLAITLASESEVEPSIPGLFAARSLHAFLSSPVQSWVNLRFSLTGAGDAKQMRLRIVHTRDLSRLWSSTLNAEEDLQSLLLLDDFILDGWVHGEDFQASSSALLCASLSR